jgi:hypothetical protein
MNHKNMKEARPSLGFKLMGSQPHRIGRSPCSQLQIGNLFKSGQCAETIQPLGVKPGERHSGRTMPQELRRSPILNFRYQPSR